MCKTKWQSYSLAFISPNVELDSSFPDNCDSIWHYCTESTEIWLIDISFESTMIQLISLLKHRFDNKWKWRCRTVDSFVCRMGQKSILTHISFCESVTMMTTSQCEFDSLLEFSLSHIWPTAFIIKSYCIWLMKNVPKSICSYNCFTLIENNFRFLRKLSLNSR